MARMDKYEEKVASTLSRTVKNEDLYKDVYLNNTLVDLNKITSLDNNVETITNDSDEKNGFSFKEIHYEEKNYDLDVFLKEKHDQKISDNKVRSLDEKVIETQDEINKIVSNISKKERDEDLFTELLPDSDNTIITDSAEETKLDSIITNDVINNFHDDSSLTNSYTIEGDDIKDSSRKKKHRKMRKAPFIIFLASFILLIGVVVYIILRY